MLVTHIRIQGRTRAELVSAARIMSEHLKRGTPAGGRGDEHFGYHFQVTSLESDDAAATVETVALPPFAFLLLLRATQCSPEAMLPDERSLFTAVHSATHDARTKRWLLRLTERDLHTIYNVLTRRHDLGDKILRSRMLNTMRHQSPQFKTIVIQQRRKDMK